MITWRTAGAGWEAGCRMAGASVAVWDVELSRSSASGGSVDTECPARYDSHTVYGVSTSLRVHSPDTDIR